MAPVSGGREELKQGKHGKQLRVRSESRPEGCQALGQCKNTVLLFFILDGLTHWDN